MGYQLQYISCSNGGSFECALSATFTIDSVIEHKFLLTGSSTHIRFAVGSSHMNVRFASYNDMYFHNGGLWTLSSSITLNEVHTAVLCATQYKFDDMTYSANATNLPAGTPVYNISNFRGNIYSSIVKENGVKTIELLPWINDNNIVGLYDTVSQTFYQPSSGTWTAGPRAHVFEPSKYSLTFPASGGSLTFDVEAETTWTASTPTFATLSPSTGGTGTTTVTATCPSYTGTTKREETITFTDNDSYTFDFKIRQRALTNGISNLYLGDNQIPTANAIYLGDAGVNTIYLGEEIVYSSGPFVGLKAAPQSFGLTNATNTANITIRSSENWTITDDSGGWLSYSTTTGTTGKTVVTVTASTTQAERTATITVISANYSATIAVTEKPHEIPYNEVWYKTRNNSSLAPDSGKYFFDSNENQLTYTESFDSESGLWKMVFNGNVYGNTGGLYRSGGGQLVEIWLPYTYVKANSMVNNSLMSFQKFKGESQTIVDGGNALVCLVGDLQNYVVDSAKKNVETITIPEGVVGLAWGCFYGSDLLTLNLPSTFSTVSGEYIFTSSKITTINCYAPTCPSRTNFLWSLFGGSGTLHYPAGSDYSNFTVPSNWTKVGDL